MDLRHVHHKALTFYLLAAVPVVAVLFIHPLTEMILAGAVLVFGGFFVAGYFTALNGHRCPDCDQLLPLHFRLTRRCPHCGKEIEYSPENR